MMKKNVQPCPVCGNYIEVSPTIFIFRCKFCKRMVEQVVERKKGKKIIHLEEKI